MNTRIEGRRVLGSERASPHPPSQGLISFPDPLAIENFLSEAENLSTQGLAGLVPLAFKITFRQISCNCPSSSERPTDIDLRLHWFKYALQESENGNHILEHLEKLPERTFRGVALSWWMVRLDAGQELDVLPRLSNC